MVVCMVIVAGVERVPGRFDIVAVVVVLMAGVVIPLPTGKQEEMTSHLEVNTTRQEVRVIVMLKLDFHSVVSVWMICYGGDVGGICSDESLPIQKPTKSNRRERALTCECTIEKGAVYKHPCVQTVHSNQLENDH